MGRCFAKVSEEEIEGAFFYPSDSRLGIYPPLFISPSGDSCIIYITAVLFRLSWPHQCSADAWDEGKLLKPPRVPHAFGNIYI